MVDTGRVNMPFNHDDCPRKSKYTLEAENIFLTDKSIPVEKQMLCIEGVYIPVIPPT